ncbi:MAG: hypothetical protein Q7R96_06630 [Nanoarchaeota archaeon]|nr:hypothetical protein [Nanoarchaeota archaeon]
MVQLSGLQTIKENEVYTGKVTRQTSEGPVEVSSIILVARYKEITSSEVFAYLQQKCEDTQGASLIRVPGMSNGNGNKTPLEQLLTDLNPVVRAHFRAGKEALKSFVYSKTSAPDEPTENRQYLHVTAGVLTQDLLDQAIEKRMDLKKVLVAPQVRIAGQGLEWSLTLTVDGNTLPDEQEVQTLLRHGVSASRTLQVSPGTYRIDEVAAVLRSVYEVCKDSEALQQFKDVRTKVLEELALQPVIELINLQRQEAQGR